jgi:hypothetical protein
MSDDGFNENLFVGNKSGMLNKAGYSNTFLGWDTGMKNGDGYENTFAGWTSGRSNATGSRNTFFGAAAGSSNTMGSSNAFVGRNAGFHNIAGSSNTFLGEAAGFNNELGGSNTFVGKNAGSRNRNGMRNTLLGNGADLGFTWDSLDLAIAIGYGANVDCSRCAVIGGTGTEAVKVGIGTTAPAGLMHLRDPSGDARMLIDGFDFSGVSFYNNTVYKAGIGYTSRPNENWFFVYEAGTASIVSRNGNVGIGTTSPAGKLDVMGNIYQNHALIHSDERFKKNIRPLHSALEKIRKLQGVSYEFRTKDFANKSFSSGRQLGLIAQELETILPELVHTRPDGYKAVNYDGLIPVLIEGIKEQQKEMEQLTEVVNQQQEQIAELQSMVRQLITGDPQQPATNSLMYTLKPPARLDQNQPNPSRQNTSIKYFVPDGVGKAQVLITAVGGERLDTLEIAAPGEGEMLIQTGSYPAGTYYYSLIIDGQVVDTRIMVLSR